MIKNTFKATLLATALCGSSVAMAEQFIIDVGVDYNPGINTATTTAPVDYFGVDYKSTTTFTDGPDASNTGVLGNGDQALSSVQAGTVPVIALDPNASATQDNNGYGINYGVGTQGWDFTFDFSNIVGTLVEVGSTSTIIYSSGTIDISLQTCVAATTCTVLNTVEVMSLEITGGSIIGGQQVFAGYVSAITAGYEGLLSFLDGSEFGDYLADPENPVLWELSNDVAQGGGANDLASFVGTAFDTATLSASFDHSGRLEFSRVPEPSHLAFLGLGLIALGFAKRKKSA